MLFVFVVVKGELIFEGGYLGEYIVIFVGCVCEVCFDLFDFVVDE